MDGRRAPAESTHTCGCVGSGIEPNALTTEHAHSQPQQSLGGVCVRVHSAAFFRRRAASHERRRILGGVQPRCGSKVQGPPSYALFYVASAAHPEAPNACIDRRLNRLCLWALLALDFNSKRQPSSHSTPPLPHFNHTVPTHVHIPTPTHKTEREDENDDDGRARPHRGHSQRHRHGLHARLDTPVSVFHHHRRARRGQSVSQSAD